MNFEPYQIYQLSGNVVVSSQQGQSEENNQVRPPGDTGVSFYLDNESDAVVDEDAPSLVDSAAEVPRVESVPVSPSGSTVQQLESASQAVSEHVSRAPHHSLGYEVHPLGSSTSGTNVSSDVATGQHVQEHVYLTGTRGRDARAERDGDSRDRPASTSPKYVKAPEFEFEGKSGPEVPVHGAGSQETLSKANTSPKLSVSGENNKAIHSRVHSAPVCLPRITIVPPPPLQHVEGTVTTTTTTGVRNVFLNDAVYSLPLPDDVVNPSSPTNITPTKLSTSPAKSGIPFASSAMARRSSESDLSTPPKGKLVKIFVSQSSTAISVVQVGDTHFDSRERDPGASENTWVILQAAVRQAAAVVAVV